jgi:hypothetical protein
LPSQHKETADLAVHDDERLDQIPPEGAPVVLDIASKLKFSGEQDLARIARQKPSAGRKPPIDTRECFLDSSTAEDRNNFCAP